jgi:hypothetical protein
MLTEGQELGMREFTVHFSYRSQYQLWPNIVSHVYASSGHKPVDSIVEMYGGFRTKAAIFG